MLLSTRLTIILAGILFAALIVCVILLKLYRNGVWHPKMAAQDPTTELDVSDKTAVLAEKIQEFNQTFGVQDLIERGIRTGNDPLPDASPVTEYLRKEAKKREKK